VSSPVDDPDLQAVLSRHDPQAVSFGFVDATVDAATRTDDNEADRDNEFGNTTAGRRALESRRGGEPVGRCLSAERGLSHSRRFEFGMDVHSVSSFRDE
jgi:hypothetical protein